MDFKFFLLIASPVLNVLLSILSCILISLINSLRGRLNSVEKSQNEIKLKIAEKYCTNEAMAQAMADVKLEIAKLRDILVKVLGDRRNDSR